MAKQLIVPSCLLVLAALVTAAVQSQQRGETAAAERASEPAAAPKPAPKKSRKPRPSAPEIEFMTPKLALTKAGHQLDCPAMARSAAGAIHVAYTDYNGTNDQLRLARGTGGRLEPVAAIGAPGVVHDPTIAVDRAGDVWCFWGGLGERDVIELRGCRVRNGETPDAVFTVAATAGSETFADAGVDAGGRVWVTWQSMRDHRPDIYAKHRDPATGEWSDEIRVSKHEEGDWEPRIAFDKKGRAWIVYDSARGNEFNLHLARVGIDGGVKTWPVAHSPQYEARASIAPTAEGDGFWIAAERGKVRWGLDARGHGNGTGSNAKKSVLFGRFDIAAEAFETIPLGHAGQAGAPVNLPAIGVGADGRPWVAYRFFDRAFWRVAVTRWDAETKSWSSRRVVPESTFGQDRSSHFVTGREGALWLCWASDLRQTKAARRAGVYLAAIDSGMELPPATPGGVERGETLDEPYALSQETPERAFDDRHKWTVGGVEYGLYWGDVHRHTDVSNCRTGFDGCTTEHFRYACDMAKLDFLGTSDHTDIGKIYAPYEWWHNQKMHDVFHVPGRLNTLYVYEREQRWPWGHRNVVFAERGGPIVYIQRRRYLQSIWQRDLPVGKGDQEISPHELWDLLKRSGKKVAVVSHTGATGMGTDWGRYDKVDYDIETLVEIFQGARVSYEGEGAPQPTAGHRPGEGYTINGDARNPPPPPAPIEDFGKHRAGTYQNALRTGRRLGVFASSDHISTHVSYGGVYCGEFTRDGIVEGFNARRTIAATDKIYLNFTCNDRPLGSIFETADKPTLWFKVSGTAKLQRVTVVRNEGNWKEYEVFDGAAFEATVTDDAPAAGENRYYIRVVQEDGNMAWSSPVWVTPTSK